MEDRGRGVRPGAAFFSAMVTSSPEALWSGVTSRLLELFKIARLSKIMYGSDGFNIPEVRGHLE
jgi:hypothetical protein